MTDTRDASSRDASLGAEIREIIVHEGPISIERYMALALTHPTKGYYTTRNPFGVGRAISSPRRKSRKCSAN